LTITEILRWADAYRETAGKWPTVKSGDIMGTIGENWGLVDQSLRKGLRGLQGGSSLAKLLAAERGARNYHQLPPLTEEQILAWADAYHLQTREWPMRATIIILGSGRENWLAIDSALRHGYRGLPGGSSLGKLLAERRGVRNPSNLPLLTEEQILAWADSHHDRTGSWPRKDSGPIPEAPGET